MDYNEPEYDQPTLFDLINTLDDRITEEAVKLKRLGDVVSELEQKLIYIDRALSKR